MAFSWKKAQKRDIRHLKHRYHQLVEQGEKTMADKLKIRIKVMEDALS